MKITCGKCRNTFDGYVAWARHPCEVHAREAEIARAPAEPVGTDDESAKDESD